jgi:hypothetical protein
MSTVNHQQLNCKNVCPWSKIPNWTYICHYPYFSDLSRQAHRPVAWILYSLPILLISLLFHMFRSILHLSFKIRTKKTQLIVKWLHPLAQQEWKHENFPAVFQIWLTYFRIIPGAHASKCQTKGTLHCSRDSWWTALKMGDKTDRT